MKGKMDVLSLENWQIFPEGRPVLVAGPCSAESEAQVMRTAAELKKCGVGVFRAGIWKPRTHPGTFEGVGTPGLAWLRKAGRELGLKVCTEVACREHVEACLEYGIDMVWTGARTTSSPFMVQEIADALSGSGIPVLVKNPVSPDIELWTGAIERFVRAGIRKLGIVHRGFSASEKTRYRNSPEWRIVIEMRSRFPELPFLCDPSHIAGDRKYVAEIAQRALDLGLDGLMIESHCEPSCALSDAAQQLAPDELAALIGRLVVREADSDSSDYRTAIDSLRARIDAIDGEILAALAARMEASRQIGECKKKSNIAILQTSRWDAVLEKVISEGREYGLPEHFVSAVFNAIHDASVQAQNDILSGSL